MTVKVIRPSGSVNYTVELRKVRIEFKDGTHMLGLINIHSKFLEEDEESVDYRVYRAGPTQSFKFRRTSDYLKDCNQTEGMITVFDASYAGREDRVCFVFLHSVKFISEEGEGPRKVEMAPPEEEKVPVRTGLSLKDRLKKYEEK
jgi:hypothetical protein